MFHMKRMGETTKKHESMIWEMANNSTVRETAVRNEAWGRE